MISSEFILTCVLAVVLLLLGVFLDRAFPEKLTEKQIKIIRIVCLFLFIVFLVCSFRLYKIQNQEKDTQSKMEPLPSEILVDDDRQQCPDADYTSIQEAINNANEGDTIKVYPGQYRERIIVDKQLTLEGIDTPILTGTEDNAIVTLSADGCTFKRFVFRPCEKNLLAGIEVNSNFNKITNNSIRDCFFGIYIKNSKNNEIIDNICTNNKRGIELEYATNSTLSGNNCNYNYEGSGIELVSSHENTIENNTCNGNKWGIILSYSSNSSLKGNICNNNEKGISLMQSDGNSIEINTCKENDYGIYIDKKDNTKIEGNTLDNKLKNIYNEEEQPITISPTPKPPKTKDSLSETELGITYVIENIEIFAKIGIMVEKTVIENFKFEYTDEYKTISLSGHKFVIITLKVYNSSEKCIEVWEVKLKGVEGTYDCKYFYFEADDGNYYSISDIVTISNEESNYEIEKNSAVTKKFLFLIPEHEEIEIFRFEYWIYSNFSANREDKGDIIFEID